MVRQLSAIFSIALISSAAVRPDSVPAKTPVLRTHDTLAALAYVLSEDDHQLLNDIQYGCFLYFWNEVGSPAQLVKDRTLADVCSVAAVGFQLSSLPIGVERGWVTREAAEARAVSVLKALLDRRDNKKFGIYLHFIDHNTAGLKPTAPQVQASTVDHALLAAGAIPAATYFGGEVAPLVDQLLQDANWKAYISQKDGFISFGWRPDDPSRLNGSGEFRHWTWHRASGEEQLVYFLAVAAPQEAFRVEPDLYYKLSRPIKAYKELPPHAVSWNGSLFTYFFSHCWIDYRSLDADDPSKFDVLAPRVDWFENSRRAVLTQRARCIEAADRFKTLAPDRWGLSPCSGQTADGKPTYLVPELRPSVMDEDHWCGGTVAPYAAGSSIIFAPQECLAALRAFRHLKYQGKENFCWKDPIQGGYGLVDSFNLDQGFASQDDIGIDAGPMLLAIENLRTGLIWELFKQHRSVQRAIEVLKLE